MGYPQEDRRTPESTLKTANMEIWWDKKISVQPPVEYNRPDIVLWDLEKKTCKIIDVSVPMDFNVIARKKRSAINISFLHLDSKDCTHISRTKLYP